MMASATSSPRRSTRNDSHAPLTLHFNSDAARKKRKYRPGGIGGGGLWQEPAALQDKMPSTEPPRPRPGPGRPRRHPRPSDQPTYPSAADAVAATTQGDGYKPREERSWEEFHPDLDLDLKMKVLSADEVDGKPSHGLYGPLHSISPSNGIVNGTLNPSPAPIDHIPSLHKRRPGRPPRHPESMLSGLGSPPGQRITPLPAHNPRERLVLPKPVFRNVDVFRPYEQDKASQVNYVNRTMESLGFQKSDKFIRPPDAKLIRLAEKAQDDEKEAFHLELDGPEQEPTGVRALNQVEYDMDEQDQQWLDAHNAYRKDQEGVDIVKPAVFEVTMTQIENEWHAVERRIPKPNPKPPQTQRPRSSSSAAVNGEPSGQGEEQDSRCAVCDDGDCENTNAIVFCDGCDLAVHQECYGVPYIPEGQWLCRKCQQVGRGTPTCIFCPNTDGAFKMTTESKWVHLVCAIWIPEVSIANLSFMEPITQVADVPKSRWKLNCYICNQKMGACIQCGNRNCFQAFHVTCARKARLYLKMKSSHGGPSTLDASVLKAYCDKHVPPEWRIEHDVDHATASAKEFYRREMKGTRWADSQQSALSMITTQQVHSADAADDANLLDDLHNAAITPAQRKKILNAQKNIWRLPSGAPVVPQVVLNAVENALQKFNPFAKRKEFVAEACKYWSLKREARRGAALLKRLQLQMETFTTTELTRRDFAAMGAAGGPKLRRRIEFATQLNREMSLLQKLCQQLKKREEIKLSDALLLREAIDSVYFPVNSLVLPVLEKAKSLDQNSKIFMNDLLALQQKLADRQYFSVSSFAMEFATIFQTVAGLESITRTINDHGQQSGQGVRDHTLSSDQKEVLKVAKRILRAIQHPLHDALSKESELLGEDYDEQLKKLEIALDSELSRRRLVVDNAKAAASASKSGDHNEGDETNLEDQDQDRKSSDAMDWEGTNKEEEKHVVVEINGSQHSDQNKSEGEVISSGEDERPTKAPSPQEGPNINGASHASTPSELQINVKHAEVKPLGIPWYLEKFDISGTTIHDERWEGRKHAESAELSDMDEDELNGLGESVNSTPKQKPPEVTKRAAKRKRDRNKFW